MTFHLNLDCISSPFIKNLLKVFSSHSLLMLSLRVVLIEYTTFHYGWLELMCSWDKLVWVGGWFCLGCHCSWDSCGLLSASFTRSTTGPSRKHRSTSCLPSPVYRTTVRSSAHPDTFWQLSCCRGFVCSSHLAVTVCLGSGFKLFERLDRNLPSSVYGPLRMHHSQCRTLISSRRKSQRTCSLC